MYALPPLNSTFIPPLGSRYFPSTPPPHPIARQAPARTETSSALRIHELFMTFSLATISYFAFRQYSGRAPIFSQVCRRGFSEIGPPFHIAQEGRKNRHGVGKCSIGHQIYRRANGFVHGGEVSKGRGRKRETAQILLLVAAVCDQNLDPDYEPFGCARYAKGQKKLKMKSKSLGSNEMARPRGRFQNSRDQPNHCRTSTVQSIPGSMSHKSESSAEKPLNGLDRG